MDNREEEEVEYNHYQWKGGGVMLTDEKLLDLESRKCFEFFWNEANTIEYSDGYGLIRDRAPGSPKASSIASVGFGLTAVIIGIERGWVAYNDALKRVTRTLDTLIHNAEHINGFFYHFMSMLDAKRVFKSEISIIDSAILLSGAISAAEYFEGDIRVKTNIIYERMNWQWYFDKNRNQFYMGYSPERGFSGWWDFYAEQLMLYMLSSASPTFPVSSESFYSFTRNLTSYRDSNPFINSWFGSLFTHQFSHAWFDFRGLVDRDNVNWFKNSVTASIVNRQYCIDQSVNYKSFNKYSWGLTACDGPYGYNGRYGCEPSAINNDEHFTDGTVTPCGAAGSIVFTPNESIKALNNYSQNYPALWGKYGFKDAFNLDVVPCWFAEDVIGINKGITLLMIENYRTGFVWNNFMKSSIAINGLEKVGFKKLHIKEAS
jgi:hypothetical protein